MKYYFNFNQKYATMRDHWERSAWVNDVHDWLIEHAGLEEKEWEWVRGDLLAVGLNIRRKEIATLFRLRFGI